MAGGVSEFRPLLVEDLVIETVVEDPYCVVLLADCSTFAAKGATQSVLLYI